MYATVVRKHRAPKGALRPSVAACCASLSKEVRKHRAPKGALRLWLVDERYVPAGHSQKAPSAKRCIKTVAAVIVETTRRVVRKHRAPKGALRPEWRCARCRFPRVRKHRAPKGALRRVTYSDTNADMSSQKAPSAKRCIKTDFTTSAEGFVRSQKAPSAKRCIKTAGVQRHVRCPRCVRKHRAPKGALRRSFCASSRARFSASESTERQKVH